MALSQSLFSAISGLINHQTRMDNVGNNLANVNTVGYKRSVLRFQDVLSQTVKAGAAPDGILGGTNPLQLGLGMQVATVTPDFAQGGLESTGKITDLAIEGDGFFKVVAGDTVRYTRDGAFTLGQDGELLTAGGFKVHGWMADENGLIDTTTGTEAIVVPLGEKRIARETDNVYYNGNLNSSGAQATQGTELTSYLLSDAVGVLGGGTLLENLQFDAGAGVTDVFTGLASGDTVTISAIKGNRTISADFAYTGTQTVNTLRTWIDQMLGLQGAGASVTLDLVNSQLVVTGDLGELNAISNLEFTVNSASTGIFTETAAADGESAVTSTIVYDSLGNEHLVTITMAMVNRTSSSSTWRWYADCVDDTDAALDVGNGTVTFGTDGGFASESGGLIRIDLDLEGVATQLVINPDFELVTQFADELGSELNVRSQDGAPMGVMTSFAIGENGIVSGLFTNGLSEDIGQICITKFANNNGLLRDAANLFSAGQNSGLAQDGVAAASGRGYVRAGTLESSNVDIAKEFTDMIVTQRGFQANARTITTSDQLLQELINLTR